MSSYTPNPADATQPTDAISAETAQAEFRALKAYIQGLMVASGTRIPKRQTVLAGPVDANGISATIGISGTALGVDLKATTSPQGLVLAWANGFNANGEQDSLQVISNDLANYWASLPINATSYLACDFVNGVNLTTVTGGPYAAGSTNMTVASAAVLQVNNMYSFALTPAGTLQSVVSAINTGTNTITLATPVPGGSSIATGTNVVGTNPTAVATKAPPQYGTAYDRTKQAVLQFGGAVNSTAFLDDFGNTWTAVGAGKIETNFFKFGTGALGGSGATNAMNGATPDGVKTLSINTLGSGGWSLRGWSEPLNALPAANTQGMIVACENAGGLGALLGIVNAAGTIKFGYYLSSNGAAFDIANAVQGATTPVLGTAYFVELTYDALAGVYRLYVNGTQESSTVSALKVCQFTTMQLGARPSGGAGYNGYIDKFEFLPYCDHPNGTAYAVPTAAPNVAATGYASDWFDIANMQMKSVSAASGVAGTNPTFAQKNRLYVGDADTSGIAVTAVRPYAINGQYTGAWIAPVPASGTSVSANDNIGTAFKDVRIEVQNLVGELGFSVGDIVDLLTAPNASFSTPPSIAKQRNSSKFAFGSSGSIELNNTTTGAATPGTAANWQYRFKAQRNF